MLLLVGMLVGQSVATTIFIEVTLWCSVMLYIDFLILLRFEQKSVHLSM